MQKILHAEQRQKQNYKDYNLLALHQESFPLNKKKWIDIEPGKYSLSEYEVSKKVIHYIEKKMERFISGE